MRFTICEKCKYNFEGECEFYSMGSGNDIDKPCSGEEEDAFPDSVMDNLRVEEENVDEIKLKQCPFCGCEEINSHTGSFGYVFFHCPKCLASVTFDKDVYSYKPQEAAKAWNRRMAANAITFELSPEQIKKCVENAIVDIIPFEQQWTPCSEIMPTKTGHYLCSFKKPNRIDKIYVDLAYWTGSRWYGYMGDEIKAWMPLPKPFEEETND